MTGETFYFIVCGAAIVGLVAIAAGWAWLHGPEWYRAKRAAAIEFQREAAIRSRKITR